MLEDWLVFSWLEGRNKHQNKNHGYKFIRIDPEKEDFDIFKAIKEIFRHIKQSTKKTLINEI